MCGSVIQALEDEQITLWADRKIYTPDGDQSVWMTKDLLMKIYNDEAAKKKMKEDKTISYCRFVSSSSKFITANRFFIWQVYLFLDTIYTFLERSMHYKSSDMHGKLSSNQLKHCKFLAGL